MIAESSELEEISEENIEAGVLQISGVESNKLVFENGHVSKKAYNRWYLLLMTSKNKI